MSQADDASLPMQTRGISPVELSPSASERDPVRPEDLGSARRNLSSAGESLADRLPKWHTCLQDLSSARLTGVFSGPSMVAVGKPFRGLGEFFAMSLDAFVLMFRPPFAWREYLLQCWFVARVSWLPGLLLMWPYAVVATFIFDILLNNIGAGDFAGTGIAILAVQNMAPVVTALAVAGPAASAMCADLGARTIREELDAMRVLGINPVQRLVVPRVLAAATVAFALGSLVIVMSLVGGFIFAVFIQHIAAGPFVAGLTTLIHLADVIVTLIKGMLFGIAGSLVACYKGISVGGGPAGVGNAVNETVALCVMVGFGINTFVTAISVQFTVS